MYCCIVRCVRYSIAIYRVVCIWCVAFFGLYVCHNITDYTMLSYDLLSVLYLNTFISCDPTCTCYSDFFEFVIVCVFCWLTCYLVAVLFWFLWVLFVYSVVIQLYFLVFLVFLCFFFYFFLVIFLLLIRRPLRSTIFPYSTLFRSVTWLDRTTGVSTCCLP